MTENLDVTDCLMRLMRSIRRYPSGKNHHSHGSIRLLRILAKCDGQNPRELAEKMDIRPSSLTELMNKLEMYGAILRVRDENDLRMIRVSLLDKGRTMLDEFKNNRKQELGSFTACLSEEEKRNFCMICNKMIGEVEKLSNDENSV